MPSTSGEVTEAPQQGVDQGMTIEQDASDGVDDASNDLPSDEVTPTEQSEEPADVSAEASYDDRIFGGPGDDWIFGQSGNDVIFGDDLEDVLAFDFLVDLLSPAGGGNA